MDSVKRQTQCGRGSSRFVALCLGVFAGVLGWI